MKKCEQCGRFVSYTDPYYIPYGSYGDLEPRDMEYLCTRCWNSMTEKERVNLKRSCWRGPFGKQKDGDADE